MDEEILALMGVVILAYFGWQFIRPYAVLSQAQKPSPIAVTQPVYDSGASVLSYMPLYNLGNLPSWAPNDPNAPWNS